MRIASTIFALLLFAVPAVASEIREFDVKPYTDKGIFTELKDLSYFRSARVVAGSVEWPHEQDFSFDTLYIAGCPVSPNQNVQQPQLSPAS